jgi:Protein of unknown function (DUF3703)
MTDHTFAVPGLASAGGHYVRAVADAAFTIPGVHAVGIDRRGATLTLTSTRPIDVTEFSAAIDGAEPVVTQPGQPGRGATELAVAWSAERAAARAARICGDRAGEWRHLERAHILSQLKALLHVRTHLAMLVAGIRRHDRHEVVGQLLRLVLAAPGSLTGRYPVGNTGGAQVSALAPMPIPDDLVPFLLPATHIEEQP